jgi:hypothetical protein
MQAEQLLIQKISSRPSTEELICFVAQDDAITSACAELHKKIIGNNKKDLKQINLLCQRYHVPFTHLARELDHIQRIFAPQKTFSNDHKLLGLQAGAGIAEVKQAYRQLSMQYHPDTSGEKNTEKFIEITKAYQRIINNPDTEKSPSPASSATWSYRKDKPFPKKRNTRYLYLFSFIGVVLLLIIATLSLHYQKRAMLNTISKKNRTSFATPSPAEQPATLAKQQSSQPSFQQPPLPLQDTETKITMEKKKEEEQEPIFQKESQVVAANTRAKASALPNLVQDNISESLVPPEEVNLKQPITPNVQPTPYIKKATPAFSPSPPFTAQSEKISTKEEITSEETTSPPPQSDDKTATTLLNQNEIQDIRKTHKEVIPSEVKQIKGQQKNSLPFSEVQYQTVTVLRPAEKKVKFSEVPGGKNNQASQDIQDISVLNSLRAFTRNYAATYGSRNLKKFALLFADGALENGVPFSSIQDKYKQLFSTTQAIEYRIDLLGTEVHKKGKTATLTGRFHVRLIYNLKNIEANSGTITFFLVKNKKIYKINAITYQLDPKSL